MRGGGRTGGRAVLGWGCSGAVPAAPGGTATAWGDATNIWSGGTLPADIRPQEQALAPFAGVLKNLYVRNSAVLGGGIDVNYTVYVNNVATAITVNISGAAQVNGQDTTNVVSVAAGDRIALAATRGAGVPPNVICRACLEIAAT